MGWHIVEKTLEGLHAHNTLAGRYWVIFFFVFRFLLLISIADTIFGDDLGNFECDTTTPGCKNVCFNTFTPISLMRYWSLQILLSALPGIIFITYVDNKQRKVELAGRIKQKKRKADKTEMKGIYKRHREVEKSQNKTRRRLLKKSSMEASIKEGKFSTESDTQSDTSTTDLSSLDSSENEDHEFRATNLRSKNMPPRVFLFYELQVIQG